MQSLEQKWESLTLADDFMFGKIMRNPKLCAEMLRRIFPSLNIEKIELVETQKTLKQAVHVRGVRFDVFTVTARNIFDVEAQKRKLKDLHRRTRAYHIAVGYNALSENSLKNPVHMKICRMFTWFLSALLTCSARADIFTRSGIFALKTKK